MTGTESPSPGNGRKWALLTALMAAVTLYAAAFEVPERVRRIADVRTQTAGTWMRQQSALDRGQALAELRAERGRLEERLARAARTGAADAGPAAVLDRIELGAASAGLTLLEMRPLDGRPGNGYHHLPIHLRLAGYFDGVRAFLRAIETGGAAMPVREVALRSPDPASAGVEAEVLLDVVIVGRRALTSSPTDE